MRQHSPLLSEAGASWTSSGLEVVELSQLAHPVDVIQPSADARRRWEAARFLMPRRSMACFDAKTGSSLNTKTGLAMFAVRRWLCGRTGKRVGLNEITTLILAISIDGRRLPLPLPSFWRPKLSSDHDGRKLLLAEEESSLSGEVSVADGAGYMPPCPHQPSRNRPNNEAR
jgi:hypothetical protein